MPEIECSYCGEWFRVGRRSCPHCGSDAETGWRSAEEQDAAAVDLPETALDDEAYDRLLAREGLRTRPARGVPWSAIVLALMLAALLLAVLT